MIKKQLIMEKSLELFAQKGFKATSVQQITEHCGISKGAFYLSFKSKEELVLALIDHFMKQITSDIDYLVNHSNADEELLYNFYHMMFHAVAKHSDFTKVLMKEQLQSINDKLLLKILYYYSLIDQSILSMLERLYGETVETTKHDLVYCMKGFISTYSELFLFYNVPLDLKLLAHSLVEKTELLAKHATVAFISEELIEITHQAPAELANKEQLLEMLEQKIEEISDSIENESLILLKQQLLEPTLSPAIVKGLLENIRKNPHCKWLSYLLRSYFKY